MSCSRFSLVQVSLVVPCAAWLSKMSSSRRTLERENCDIIQSLEKHADGVKESAKMVGDRLAKRCWTLDETQKRLSRKWGNCKQKKEEFGVRWKKRWKKPEKEIEGRLQATVVAEVRWRLTQLNKVNILGIDIIGRGSQGWMSWGQRQARCACAVQLHLRGA